MPAVLEYAAKIDKADLTADTIRVSAAELAAAHAAADPALLACVRRVRDSILAFQTAILHTDARVERPGGVVLEQRYVPLRRVGVCVPGGAAAYPSTVLMTVVPAQAAGVKELAVVAPPTGLSKDGASTVYRRIEVPAGKHHFTARMKDAPAGGFGAVAERTVDLQPGRILVIDYDAKDGWIFRG